MGAVGALAPIVFLPCPKVVLILAPMLFSPVRRQCAYCNSFLKGQLLHIAIFNSFFSHYCYCNSSDGYCQCLVLYIVENGKIQ